jgi:hypothetical protein
MQFLSDGRLFNRLLAGWSSEPGLLTPALLLLKV